MANMGDGPPKLMLAALAMAVATPGAAANGDWPLPPPRPPELAPAEPPPPTPRLPPKPPETGEAAPSCLWVLIAAGARAEAAPAPAQTIEGCGIESPIRLSSVTSTGGEAVSLPAQPLLDCKFALVFADYVRLIVAPLGEAMLHAKVASIETGPGYECRSRDRVADGKISAHAKGLAVDFFAVELTDGRRVLVEHQADADETSYVRAMRSAACGWFTTVLGPGADTFHADHMHLDIENHGSSGSYRICQ
jgi:hypothetical protein